MLEMLMQLAPTNSKGKWKTLLLPNALPDDLPI
jgi:hypothetical protein